MSERVLPPVSFGDDARGKLLAAGWETMAAADGSILESGFNPERIATAAGVSRRTFYRHFPDKYSFVAALADAVLDKSFGHYQPAVIERFNEFEVNDLFADVREGAQIFWETLGRRETTLARVTLMTLAANAPGVLDGARRSYEESIERNVPAWESLFDAWDLELRPPWTTHRFASFMSALLDGILMRRAFEPELFDSMFADVVMAVTPLVFRLRGGSVPDIDDMAERLALAVRRRHNQRVEAKDSLDRSELINDELVKLLRARGLRGTSVEALALATSLSVDTIRLKGTIDEQVCRVAQQQLSKIQEELVFDIETLEGDQAEIAQRHSERLRLVVASNPEIFAALMELRLSGTAELEYLHVFEELVETASRSGKQLWVGADAIVGEAEQVILSELLSWKQGQQRVP